MSNVKETMGIYLNQIKPYIKDCDWEKVLEISDAYYKFSKDFFNFRDYKSIIDKVITTIMGVVPVDELTMLNQNHRLFSSISIPHGVYKFKDIDFGNNFFKDSNFNGSTIILDGCNVTSDAFNQAHGIDNLIITGCSKTQGFIAYGLKAGNIDLSKSNLTNISLYFFKTKELKLPDDIKIIATGSILPECNLKNLIIPDSVIEIEDDAIATTNSRYSIENIQLGPNIKKLCHHCISNCVNLTYPENTDTDISVLEYSMEYPDVIKYYHKR